MGSEERMAHGLVCLVVVLTHLRPVSEAICEWECNRRLQSVQPKSAPIRWVLKRHRFSTLFRTLMSDAYTLACGESHVLRSCWFMHALRGSLGQAHPRSIRYD